ncbi:MAG: nuclear transport factor 2 family protein [Asgard group archaeon]|nr:nuclear transport factor 2 family protein [Asgard group archaeon]
MSNNKYVEIIRKMYLAFNNRDLDEWAKHFDEDTVDYPSKDKPSKGRKKISENNDHFLKRMPDAKYEFANIIGQDKIVCAEGIMTGTPVGTDQPMKMLFCIVIKFEGEMIRERHWYFAQ